MNTTDAFWMRRCITLAQKGTGNVSPNPLVGAVIVKNGRKIGEGFHRVYGEAHAEINAIKEAGKKENDLEGATIYINLEPCFHYGHTPPCVDEIIKRRFSRVVIAMNDPNSLVAGKSVRKLLHNNIQCTVGVLRKEAEYLNEKFIKYISKGIPFVALKAAQSADGFIAHADGRSRWITNKQSRTYVHRLRNEYDAVLVGATTAMKDDPELTVRLVKGRNPLRVIIDGNFSIESDRKIFNGKTETMLFTSKTAFSRNREKVKQLKKKKVSIIVSSSNSGKLRVNDVLVHLGKKKIASVLVEGGSKIYSAFLKEKAVDKIYLFTAEKKFEKGVKTFYDDDIKESSWHCGNKRMFGTDTLEELYPA